jgi:hypothetical protein
MSDPRSLDPAEAELDFVMRQYRRAGVILRTSDPYHEHARLVPDDPDSRVSRLYRWLKPVTAVDLVSEYVRVPNAEELLSHHRSLAEERGWTYMLLPGPWAILPPEDQEGAVATRPRPYHAGDPIPNPIDKW